jgi:hypothetical protein
MWASTQMTDAPMGRGTQEHSEESLCHQNEEGAGVMRRLWLW